jgi:hypothetical protein
LYVLNIVSDRTEGIGRGERDFFFCRSYNLV